MATVELGGIADISAGRVSLLRHVADTCNCASGGIGRRAGFRCQCPQGRGGSTPPSRTFSFLGCGFWGFRAGAGRWGVASNVGLRRLYPSLLPAPLDRGTFTGFAGHTLVIADASPLFIGVKLPQ